jgi:ribosomal protein L21E
LLDFSIGEQVSIRAEDGSKVKGIITKYNQKTVTVVTESGQCWKVPPSFLQKSEPSTVKDQVIDMPKK